MSANLGVYYIMKKYYLIFTLIFIASLGYSCTPSPQAERNHLIVGIAANPTNLDPRRATDAASARVTQIVFNGLLRKDSQSKLAPDLAERWEQPDDKTYIFHLRHNVKFHDGSTLTARDVKYTFASIMDEAYKSPRRSSFKEVDSIDIIDDYTIKFTLKKPFAPFLINMTMGIVPEHTAESQKDKFSYNPCGTGPFRFISWQADERLQFTAFADYYEGAPKLKKITYKIIPEDSLRLLELEKGSIHLIQNSIPPDLLPRCRQNPNLKVITSAGTTFAYAGFNFTDPILRIKKVRLALALAIDRQSIIKHILGNLAAPARSLLPKGHWAYEPEAIDYEYNLKKARRLLDEAGFRLPDTDTEAYRFKLTYKTSQNEQSRRVAEVLQRQWQKLGIKVEIKSHEWGTFFSDINSGNFQLYTLQWVGVTEPDIYYYIFHSSSMSPAGANRGKYINPKLDALLEQGRNTLDTEKRKAIYSKVQRMLSEELPYINLWHLMNVVVMRKNVAGFTPYPGGDFTSLKDVYIAD